MSVNTHTHGNLSNSGAIGSTSGLPVVTTTSGAVTTLALGSALQVLRVNSGGTAVEFAAAGGGDEIADDLFRVIGSADATKKVAFEVDGLTASTTRTLTVPDKNFTLAGTTNTITLASSNHNPAAGGQSYYIANAFDLAPVTNPTFRDFQVPINSLITGISVSIHIGGTLGVTAGSASIALYNKNTSTAQNLLNTGIVFSSSANSFSISGLSISMAASTPYVVQITTPIFSTTPTTVRYCVILYLENQ